MNTDEFERVRSALTETLDLINVGAYVGAKNEWWAGADVVISDSTPRQSTGTFYPEPRHVTTPYPDALSWLFYRLRDAFEGILDSQTKIEFYGRLANAANRYQVKSDTTNERDLLSAVLHEGYAMADEMEEGSFESLPVAAGGEIVDDYIDEAYRNGFMSIEETRAYLAELEKRLT